MWDRSWQNGVVCPLYSSWHWHFKSGSWWIKVKKCSFFIPSTIPCLWLKHFTYPPSLPSDKTDPSSPRSHIHSTETWAPLGHIINLICIQMRAGPSKVEANSCWCDWTSGSGPSCSRNVPSSLRAVLAPVPVGSPAHHQDLWDQRHHFPLLKVAVAPGLWLMSANST